MAIKDGTARNFNPLPRKRENCRETPYLLNKKYFNPLPRKRENGRTTNIQRTDEISIHSLVRGRTVYADVIAGEPSDFNPLPRKRENCGKML